MSLINSMIVFQYSLLLVLFCFFFFAHCSFSTVALILPKTVTFVCNTTNEALFQRMTASADPSSSTWGSFAGFYKSQAGCQRHCNKNFKEKCYAYMYEPKNRGSCTNFQQKLYDRIEENANSTISIYKKCFKMPPAVSAKCCGPLIQRHSTNSFSDANMTVTYNDNTCRSKATVTCLEGRNIKELYVNFVINENYYIKAGANSTAMSATCYNGIWQTSFYNITSLECTTF